MHYCNIDRDVFVILRCIKRRASIILRDINQEITSQGSWSSQIGKKLRENCWSIRWVHYICIAAVKHLSRSLLMLHSFILNDPPPPNFFWRSIWTCQIVRVEKKNHDRDLNPAKNNNIRPWNLGLLFLKDLDFVRISRKMGSPPFHGISQTKLTACNAMWSLINPSSNAVCTVFATMIIASCLQ